MDGDTKTVMHAMLEEQQASSRQLDATSSDEPIRRKSSQTVSPRPVVHPVASMRSRNPRLEGYLYKKTKGIKGIRHFQRRWVVLYPDSCMIAYYRKRKDADKEFHVRNNMGVTVMPWAATGIIPIDLITSVYPTKKTQRFDITVSRAAGKSKGKTYQWKCLDRRQRDLWVEAIALVHYELQKLHASEIVDEIESDEDEATAAADALVLSKPYSSEKADTVLALRSISDGSTDAAHESMPVSSKRNIDNSQTLRKSLSISPRSLANVNNDLQISEVLGKLLTTDRFASLRPPPSSSHLAESPSLSESVGRSLIGADHMPNSGESDIEDSDSSDDYDTDETDPEDVRDYLHERHQQATNLANNAPMLVERDRGYEGTDIQTPIPVHMRSNTLVIDADYADHNNEKQGLLTGVREIGSPDMPMKPRTLEIDVGWLHKLGRINKSWRRRFFVLTHGQLRYYTSPTRRELKGVMDLINIKVTDVEAKVFRPPFEYCLEVCHSISNRQLVLAFEDSFKKERWRQNIKESGIQSIKELPPGMSTGKISSSEENLKQVELTMGSKTNGHSTTHSRSGSKRFGMNLESSNQNTVRVLENADWAGFVSKCGRVKKTWNSRLFVLRGSLLTYFKANTQPVKIVSRKGAIVLAGARVENALREDGSRGIDVFTNELHGKTRRLMLKFPTSRPESLSQWLGKLKYAADNYVLSVLDDGHLHVKRVLSSSTIAKAQVSDSDSTMDPKIVPEANTSPQSQCSGCQKQLSRISTNIFASQGNSKGYQCPACGLLFCNTCSSSRLPLVAITGSLDVMRVCDSCYDIESRRLIESQAATKREKEEHQLIVRKRQLMESLNWWYQDTIHGKRQGPFGSAKMRSWYLDGYLSLDLLLWWDFNDDGHNAFLRKPMSLVQIFPDAGNKEDDVFVLAHSLAAEESNWVESTDPASGMKYYYNIVTEVSSWELPTVSGQYAATLTVKQSASTLLKAETASLSANIDPEAIYKYHYGLSDSWYYKDHSCVQQGPFHADEMRAWMDAGYFTSALYARLGDAGPFKLLQNLYPDLLLAFTCPPPGNTTDVSNAGADILDRQETQESKIKLDSKRRSASMTMSVDKQRFSSMHLQARKRTFTQPYTKKDIDGSTIHKKGFLEKRGRINKNWKRRFFVLDNTSLTYFTKESGKKKGEMMMTGIRIEKYETKSISTGSIEFCIDIIANDRRLILKADDAEDQLRWAVAIENASHSTNMPSSIVPLPLNKPSQRIPGLAPSDSMLNNDFSVVKVASPGRVSTSLSKYRSRSLSVEHKTRNFDMSGSELSNLSNSNLQQYATTSGQTIDKLDTKLSKRALRGTLRNMDHGQCDTDRALIEAHHHSVEKNEQELSMLLDAVGSNSHPDLVKLNIFTRLDESALEYIIGKMFKIPTYSGMQIMQEGDAGELFYVVGKGTYDVHVVGHDVDTGSKDYSLGLRHKLRRKRSDSRSRGSSLSTYTPRTSNGSVTTFCTTLKAGDCFGEGALLNATRPASVICSTQYNNESIEGSSLEQPERAGGWIWALQRDTYQFAVRKYEQRLKREHAAFLKSIPLFSGGKLTAKELSRLSDAIETRQWEAGETIVKKGSAKRKLYIIKFGQVITANEKDKQAWFVGESFGNRALLYGEKWDVSLVAKVDTICLVLKRKEFNEIVGGLKEKIFSTWSRERKRSLHEAVDTEAVRAVKDSDTAKVSVNQHTQDKELCESKNRESDVMQTPENLMVNDKNSSTSLCKVEHGQRDFEIKTILAEIDDIDSDDSIEEDDELAGECSDDEYEEEDLPWDKRSCIYSDIQLDALEPRALLGAGSFGEVKLVLHKNKFQRHYALKCMRRNFIVENGFESMVENERCAMCELAGCSIFLVNLYNTYQDDINIYMLMELCTGGELYDYLSKQEGKCVSIAAAQFYVACILEGLDAMHSRDIIYRDLKPENVILDEGGYCKIVDFGLAKKTRQTFTVCGTPEYMAPEVVVSRGHNAGVDYWALGVMMYEMIAGYTPFVGGDQMEIYEHILAHEKRDDLVFEASGFKYNGRARSLIKRLLHPKKTKRLGSLAGGADDVRNHPFFAKSKRLLKFDWTALNKMQLDSPYTPPPADFQKLSTFDELEQDDNLGPEATDRSGWKPLF